MSQISDVCVNQNDVLFVIGQLKSMEMRLACLLLR